MVNKQLELFSVDDMYGCIGVEDEIDAISVAAYLWAMRVVSDLDDERFRKVKKECEAVKFGEGEYFVPSIPGSMNIFQLDALRDCLNLREHAAIGEKYVHHYPEAYCRPHVSAPYWFVMARKAFKAYYCDEFQKNGWWIPDLNYRQLTKCDLYEEQEYPERNRHDKYPLIKMGLNMYVTETDYDYILAQCRKTDIDAWNDESVRNSMRHIVSLSDQDLRDLLFEKEVQALGTISPFYPDENSEAIVINEMQAKLKSAIIKAVPTDMLVEIMHSSPNDYIGKKGRERSIDFLETFGQAYNCTRDELCKRYLDGVDTKVIENVFNHTNETNKEWFKWQKRAQKSETRFL